MNRRAFLKLLGYSSIALAIPTSIKYLVDHVVANTYDRDLLQELFGDILNKLTPEEFAWLESLKEDYYLFKVDGNVTVTKSPKSKYFIDSVRGKDWEILEKTNNIFEASIKERQYDLQLKGKGLESNGQPYFWSRVRSRRAVIDRPNNLKWKKSRGQQHSINSTKVKVFKGRKVGNARWGTLDIVDQYYFGTYNSLGEAAKATGVTKAAISYCVLGKMRFAKGFTFEEVA